MKKLTLTLFTFLLFSSFSSVKTSSGVYICTDSNAKTYHSSYSCKGFGSCKGDIKGISMEQAIKMGRKSCKICFEKEIE